MKRVVLVLWIISLAGLVFQSAYFYPELPERIASHFDSQGKADGWSSKTGFYVLWYFLIVFMNVWVPLSCILLRKVPSSMLSIPHKEYWLATEERKGKLGPVIFVTMAGVFIGVNIIMFMVFQHTALFSLGRESSLRVFEIVVLVVVLIAFAIGYPLLYLRPPKSDSD
jgi:uncharacterized membrane protein